MSAARRIAAGFLALVLGGCATFSPDGGRSDVEQIAKERIGASAGVLGLAADDSARRAAAEERLAATLSVDAAVEVALLNQPGIQARLAELGIAEAEYVQSGRLRNPIFTYSNKRAGEIVEIERALLVNVASLVTMPLALEIGERRFAQAKVAAASEVVAAASTVRLAWFRAVAAQERQAYDEQVVRAAEVGSELARRMAAVGNWSALSQMRQHAFYADAVAALARSRHEAVAERERLARLLGVERADAFRLPERLPDLPATSMTQGVSEQTALDRRLDVRIAKADADAVGRSLGLTRATRFVNVLEAGYANTSSHGEPRLNGYEIEVELPLFDFGDAKLARAEARYRQALAAVAEVAINARSEVRESYSAYRTAYDIAKHYRDEVVPLRARIADEMLLRYNGMLISVFDLLADARMQASTIAAAIDAKRDFWLAESALQSALAGRSPGSLALAGRSTASLPESAGGH